MSIIQTSDKNRVIEVREEGGDIVVGCLIRGAKLYNNSVLMSRKEAAKLIPLLEHYVENGSLPQE